MQSKNFTWSYLYFFLGSNFLRTVCLTQSQKKIPSVFSCKSFILFWITSRYISCYQVSLYEVYKMWQDFCFLRVPFLFFFLHMYVHLFHSHMLTNSPSLSCLCILVKIDGPCVPLSLVSPFWCTDVCASPLAVPYCLDSHNFTKASESGTRNPPTVVFFFFFLSNCFHYSGSFAFLCDFKKQLVCCLQKISPGIFIKLSLIL